MVDDIRLTMPRPAADATAAQARERDHRRKVIELVAAYAMNNGMVDGLSAETATSWAVHAGFELWEKLDQRFKREQQDKGETNDG